MAEVAISTEGLVKRYGRHRGLTGLDLEVQRSEVYGFLGPNGAGKTTTIRLLLDLIRPTGGRASVLGLDPRRDGSRCAAGSATWPATSSSMAARPAGSC
jgi:ABC-2 type transport system ATP-binding protein